MSRLSRAIGVVLCTAAFLFLFCSAAIAQETTVPLVVPATDGSGWDFTPVLAQAQNFLATVLLLVITAVASFVAKPIYTYFGIKVEAEQIVKDLNMDKYAKLAAAEAIRWAKQQTGATDEKLKDVELRNPFLALAAGYLFRQDSEVWRWAANSEKGVMQYIEAQLASDAAMPVNNVPGVGPVPLTTPVKP